MISSVKFCGLLILISNSRRLSTAFIVFKATGSSDFLLSVNSHLSETFTLTTAVEEHDGGNKVARGEGVRRISIG